MDEVWARQPEIFSTVINAGDAPAATVDASQCRGLDRPDLVIDVSWSTFAVASGEDVWLRLCEYDGEICTDAMLLRIG
jgi:hypothetical protein